MLTRAIPLGAAFSLAACTSMGNLETRMPIMTDLAQYESIDVRVTSGASADGRRWRLEMKLVKQLRARGNFRQVAAGSAGPDAHPDLTLLVEAVTLPRGGFWDRSIFGKGEVRLEVELVDNATRNVIGSCSVEAESTVGALWSSSGARAVDRAVEKVSECVTPG